MYHVILNIFSNSVRKQINVNVLGKRACERFVNAPPLAQLPTT